MGKLKTFFTALAVITWLQFSAHAQVGNITSIAGDGTGAGVGGAFGGDGGAATSAQLNFPRTVALDAAGNLYIADGANNVVRRVDAITGVITTFAGTGASSTNGDGGPATSAALNNPHGVTVDPSGNVYISEIGGLNGPVRKVDAVTGNISTVVSNGFYRGLFAAPNGDIYMAAFTRVDKLDTGGNVTTVAGDGSQSSGGDGGPATSAQTHFVTSVALDSAGNLYIVELFGHVIRKVDATTGIISTIAGTAGTSGSTGDGGQASAALLSSPHGIAIDGADNIFISQTGENNIHIRKIDAVTGIITTVAGTGASSGSSGVDGDGGPALQATFNDPAGMVVNAAGDLLIADQVNHKVRQILGIAVPPGGNPTPPDTVKVTVGMALVAPGDTIRVPVLIENPVGGPDVGGLQMAVVTETPGDAEFVRVEDTQGNAGFDVLVNEFSPGTVNFTLFSSNNSTIAGNANPVQIATLVYVVDANAALGSTNELDIQGLLIGDEQGDAVPGKICIGSINVGIKGDIDGDGVVTILDVIKLARILVGTDPEPAAGTTAFKIADADNSGDLTVNDITAMINIILNNPIPPVKPVSGPVAVTLDAARVLENGQTVVPVRLDGGALLAGMQASFTFDPSTLSVGTIQLGGRADGIEVISHVEDGVLRVVVFRYSPDALLPTGSDPVLLIPVTADGEGASLTLGDVQISTPWAQPAQVVVGNTTASVGTSVKSSGPSSFSLSGNAPNPFNPSTTISYEVPATAHVQLVVYNLLGQEVVRLVNQVQAAGRYEVIWDARNALGQAVSSGVYVYRLTSDTGHSEAKRMTLLK